MIVEKLLTASGIPIFTANLAESKGIAVGVLLKGGTRDEILPREAGMAHAREHMVFQGTETFPTSIKIDRAVEGVGGTFNASTGYEHTIYFAFLPAEYTDRAVNLVCDLMFKPVYPEEKIGTEMKAIISEIAMQNDDPKDYLSEISRRQIFGGHPLSREILGRPASLRKFTKQSFLDFDRRLIASDRLAFIASGSFDGEKIKALFERYSAGVRPSSAVRAESPRPEIVKKIRIKKRKHLTQSQVYLAALIPGIAERPALALDFFSDMVGGGASFPLFRELRDKRGLCYEVSADCLNHSDCGAFQIYFGTHPDNVKLAKKLVFEIISDAKRNADLFNYAKSMILGRLALREESALRVFIRLATEVASFGRPKTYEELADGYHSLTLSEIEAAVDEYLNPDLFAHSELRPITKAKGE